MSFLISSKTMKIIYKAIAALTCILIFSFKFTIKLSVITRVTDLIIHLDDY